MAEPDSSVLDFSADDARSVFAFLSPAARDMMERLFTSGPKRDLSLDGRAAHAELAGMGLVFEVPSGWWSLTPQGVLVAIHADVADRPDLWWHRKQERPR